MSLVVPAAPRLSSTCMQGFDAIIKGKHLAGHEAAHKAAMKKYNLSQDGGGTSGKAGQVRALPAGQRTIIHDGVQACRCRSGYRVQGTGQPAGGCLRVKLDSLLAWPVLQQQQKPVCCVMLLQDQPELRFAQPSKKAKLSADDQPVSYRWNWVGVLLCGYYIAAAIYYFLMRATRTLNIGYTG